MTLEEIQQEVKEWANKNFGPEDGSKRKSYHPLLGAVEELGELAHAHLKDEQGIRTNENHREAKIDALADIIVYLCDYAALEEINLQDALEKTWEVVKKRNWKKNTINGQ